MREVMPTTVAATFATEMFATNQQLERPGCIDRHRWEAGPSLE